MSLKNKLKKISFIKKLYPFIKISNKFIKINILLYFKKMYWFITQYRKFTKLLKNKNFSSIEFYPCLFDNIAYTPIEPVYFYQDTWFTNKLFQLHPKTHYDVGSSVKTMAILSQYIPITMVDIRPINLKLKGLNFIKGNILDLPFKNNSIESISALCVIEHIGLGRYGDKLDQFGSEKAIKELKRVVKKGGVLFLSVPVDIKNKIYFNAHRVFTREYILSLFDNFILIEEKYQYGNKLYNSYDKNKGFGTGLFMLKKI